MRSQHNQIYWHGKPYAAYGNGAASFVNAVRASSNLVTLDLVFVNVCFQQQAHDCKYCPCCPKFSVQSLSVYEVIQFAISNVHDRKLHIFNWSRYVSWLSCDLAYLDHFDFNASLGPRGLDAYCDWIHNGAPESNLELDTSQRDNLADAMPLKAAMKKKDEKGRAWIANSWLSDSNFFFLCWTMRLFFSKRGTWGNFRWSLREWYMCWRWWDEIFIYWLWHT